MSTEDALERFGPISIDLNVVSPANRSLYQRRAEQLELDFHSNALSTKNLSKNLFLQKKADRSSLIGHVIDLSQSLVHVQSLQCMGGCRRFDDDG